MAKARSIFVGFMLFLSASVIGFLVCDSYLMKSGTMFMLEKYSMAKKNTGAEVNLCYNLLENITDGNWVKNTELLPDNTTEEYQRLVQDEREFDAFLHEFRVRRGIYTQLWRDDLKCGLKNVLSKPAKVRWGPNVAAWCDAASWNPCCSDENGGVCGRNCDCERCIDTRKILHAEFSQWITAYKKCSVKKYTAKEICNVVRRFSEIHFVGDSFGRKMARTFILLIREDPKYGASAKSYNKEMKDLCKGDEQLYWSECRFPSGNFQQILLDNSRLCGMDLQRFSLRLYISDKYAKDFLNFLKGIVGKTGSIVFLSIGVHMECNSSYTIENYLGPAIDYLTAYHDSRNIGRINMWPRLIFMTPDTPGLLKAPVYRSINGRIVCSKYSDEMKIYLDARGIPVMDFRKLTKNVHSYDGQHHGLGVNFLKVQIMLNYLDSLVI